MYVGTERAASRKSSGRHHLPGTGDGWRDASEGVARKKEIRVSAHTGIASTQIREDVNTQDAKSLRSRSLHPGFTIGA